MYGRLDDLIALTGLICLITGIYLWLGIPAALIVTGAILIYVGVRLDVTPKVGNNEPD
jgi:hypothetical protein